MPPSSPPPHSLAPSESSDFFDGWKRRNFGGFCPSKKDKKIIGRRNERQKGTAKKLLLLLFPYLIHSIKKEIEGWIEKKILLPLLSYAKGNIDEVPLLSLL
jgi:hypothetical protein